MASTLGSSGKLAIGVFLVWFGSACLFVAFMSGKTAALTTGHAVDSSGKPITDAQGNPVGVGPRNASELLQRVAETVQSAEGGS